MGNRSNGQQQEEQQAPKNRPVKEFRRGNVRASIWRNIVDNGNGSGPVYNATVECRYRVKDTGEWRSTQSYRPLDLVHLEKVAGLSDAWIASQQERDRAEQKDEPEEQDAPESESEPERRPQQRQQNGSRR